MLRLHSAAPVTSKFATAETASPQVQLVVCAWLIQVWYMHVPAITYRHAAKQVAQHPCLAVQVNAFYDFWYTFKSWREFPHPDEEDVEGAESREHKRWIDR